MNAITPIQSIRRTIESLAPEFAKVLPAGVSPERFRRVCLTAIQQNEKLLECTPDSLWAACMKAAQDGLLPDGREGAIVPRWNGKKRCMEAHWMPMVFGIISKAKRKGSVASLSAQVVYEGEKFQVLLGDEERIDHVRDIQKMQRGKEVAVYAIATLKDGTKEREVMSWDQVRQVADASQKDRDGNLGAVWRVWEDEMARKSVIRRLNKRLPSLDEGDDELRRTIERVDELYDFGNKQSTVSPPALNIAHEQVVQPFDLNASEREPVPVEESRAEMDRTLNGDDLPNFDAPKPDPLLRSFERIKGYFAQAAAAIETGDHEKASARYNWIMGQSGVQAEWDRLKAERPEMASELETLRAETLARIHAAGAPADDNEIPELDA